MTECLHQFIRGMNEDLTFCEKIFFSSKGMVDCIYMTWYSKSLLWEIEDEKYIKNVYGCGVFVNGSF